MAMSLALKDVPKRSSVLPVRRRIRTKSFRPLPETADGNLIVDSVTQTAGNVTPEDWANVTNAFKEKELKRRQTQAANRAKREAGSKGAPKAKPKAKAKTTKKAKKTKKTKKAKTTCKKPENGEVISWATYTKREHSKVWHKEVGIGKTDLGLTAEKAKERAGEVARAFLANLRKQRAEGKLTALAGKVDIGCDVD